MLVRVREGQGVSSSAGMMVYVKGRSGKDMGSRKYGDRSPCREFQNCQWSELRSRSVVVA